MSLILPRRRFLGGLASLLAAPAIVKASSLMPVKAMVSSPPDTFYWVYAQSGTKLYRWADYGGWEELYLTPVPKSAIRH